MHTPHRQEYQIALQKLSDKLQIKRYSRSTQRVYYQMFEGFLNFVHPLPLHRVGKQQIMDYQVYLVSKKGVSSSYQNQSINAIKFYLERVLGQDTQYYELERPIKPQKLPDVLSMEDVCRILQSTTNLKHKAMLMTLYSGGLRMGELLNLRIGDIDSAHMRIWIREGKGVKDRLTVLSETLLALLRDYYKAY